MDGATRAKSKPDAFPAGGCKPGESNMATSAIEQQQTEPHVLDIARGVLRAEIEGLRQCLDGLDDSFVAAVDAILRIDGRVVVSGMGKSGHIGRKITATLASTGTPSQFVHPAEASHGDLGMLTERDLALVLSNSGETPELSDIIAHTRRFGIPLIGIAARADSALMRAADIRLQLPPAAEACPMGLAPTTSTAMTMAIGDALAVALMARRRFTPERFRAFHPGGALGAKLLTVRALMHGADSLPLVLEDRPMSEAILQMSGKSFGVAGVIDDDGRLVGVISDGDLRRKMDKLLSLTAGQVATRSPKTIGPDKLAGEAVAMMNAHKITCLFVVDPDGDRQAIGLIHVHDCLRAGVV